MLQFSAIYFDSNSFIEGGWPIPNTRLRNVLSFAGGAGVSVFLLKPVEDELEEHWVREFDNAVGRTKIPKLLDGLGIQHELQIPDRETVRDGYKKAAENAVKIWAIQRGPATSKSLTDLYGMAIRHQRPFVEGGRGFQDAVIAFSAIEHAVTLPGKACAFVSQDGAFDQACLDRLAGPLGV